MDNGKVYGFNASPLCLISEINLNGKSMILDLGGPNSPPYPPSLFEIERAASGDDSVYPVFVQGENSVQLTFDMGTAIFSLNIPEDRPSYSDLILYVFIGKAVLLNSNTGDILQEVSFTVTPS